MKNVFVFAGANIWFQLCLSFVVLYFSVTNLFVAKFETKTMKP